MVVSTLNEPIANLLNAYNRDFCNCIPTLPTKTAFALRQRLTRHTATGFFHWCSRANNELVASNGRFGAISNLLPFCSFDYAVADKLEIWLN
jgi:hypothetical protein